MPPAVPHVKAGRVRAIAVTSAARSPALPDVPTVNEQGYAGFDDLTWFGFFAPAGTPPEIVNRLNEEINRILESADIREKFAQQALDSSRNTPGGIRYVPQVGDSEVGAGDQGIGREGGVAEFVRGSCPIATPQELVAIARAIDGSGGSSQTSALRRLLPE